MYLTKFYLHPVAAAFFKHTGRHISLLLLLFASVLFFEAPFHGFSSHKTL